MTMKKILSLFLIVFMSITILGKFFIPSNLNPADKSVEEQPEKKPKKSSFSVMAVGDNLIHDTIYYPQYMAGAGYDFEYLYQYTEKYAKKADLSYLNLETLCAGEQFEFSGYPMFNGPTEILDAALRSGFNWLSASSNHSLDRGAEGLMHEVDYVHQKYPNVSITGAYSSKEASEEYVVRDINGIRVGLLGYTYGTNGIPLPEEQPWVVDIMDEDEIKKDMKAISKISDVQIVSMHWGQEYMIEPDETQVQFANLLNECGAEVIIGSHPHVIQPAEIMHGKNQDTLIYYSLGNFISHQDTNDRMVGGMASFTLNYDFNSKKTTFSNTKFIPTVTYVSADWQTHYATTILEYTEDMRASHDVTQNGYDMSKAWIQDYVYSIMKEPEGIEVVYE